MPRRSSTPLPGSKRAPRRNALALRLLHTQEEERRRVARMLHDDLGQTLTAAVLELEYAKAAPDGAELIDATLIELRRLLGAARDLSLLLRPALIDEEGLEAALGALVSRLSSARGTDIQLRCRVPRTLPADLGLIAFRIVQDAAAALCTQAACFAIFVRATPVALRLTFDASTRLHGNDTEGSVSIADRTAMVGGTLLIRLLRGGGCRMEVSLPLPRPPSIRARPTTRSR